MGEGLGVVLRGFEKKTIFGVPECPRKIDLEAQWGGLPAPTALRRKCTKIKNFGVENLEKLFGRYHGLRL